MSVQGGQALGPLDITQRTAQQWLVRMQEASRSRNYTGTVVELHASGAMAVSRVWHAVRDGQQFERIDALDGAASTVYRHDGVSAYLHAPVADGPHRAKDLLQAPPGPPGDLFVPPYTAHLLGRSALPEWTLMWCGSSRVMPCVSDTVSGVSAHLDWCCV